MADKVASTSVGFRAARTTMARTSRRERRRDRRSRKGAGDKCDVEEVRALEALVSEDDPSDSWTIQSRNRSLDDRGLRHGIQVEEVQGQVRIRVEVILAIGGDPSVEGNAVVERRNMRSDCRAAFIPS